MIISVVGPTGVGKTKMSIELAKKFNAEVIVSDSMQVYKEMNIGTAKITEKEKEGIKHHLIDIKNVNEEYSVYDYQKDARKVLDNLIKNKKNVVIVGGTGLYLKALLYDYKFEEIKERKDFSLYTNKEFYDMVKQIDSNSKIHINNRQRLESFLNNHSKLNTKSDCKLLYEDVLIIGLTRPRKELYDVIDNRVDEMIKNGLIYEAKKLYDDNIRTRAISTAIGYKELYEYFDGNLTLEEAISLIKKRSRNYAKRQYTWFNNQMNVKWFDIDNNDFNNTVNEVINYVKNELKP